MVLWRIWALAVGFFGVLCAAAKGEGHGANRIETKTKLWYNTVGAVPREKWGGASDISFWAFSYLLQGGGIGAICRSPGHGANGCCAIGREAILCPEDKAGGTKRGSG